MRKFLLAAVGVVALTAGRAQACQGQHMVTTGTGSPDAGCIFNVNVGVDATITDAEIQWNQQGLAGYNGIAAFDQMVADQVAQSLNGLGAPDAVNLNQTTLAGWGGGENSIAFQIPAGTQEVTITVTDSNGGVATAEEVAVNGTFTTQALAGGATPCAAQVIQQPPPNPAIPGPGLDPDDNKAAMNAQMGGNVPLNDHDGDDRANRKGRVE